MKSYDIKKLAHMARIYITEEEGASIEKSFESIIGYVDQIRDLETGNAPGADAKLYNVTRDDAVHERAAFSRDSILDDMPFRDGDYLKVKKIL